MKRLSNVALLTLFVIVTASWSLAADVTVAELMQAAIRRQLRQQESRCHGSALHLGWSLSLTVWPDRAWSGRPPELLREALCLRCPQPCD